MKKIITILMVIVIPITIFFVFLKGNKSENDIINNEKSFNISKISIYSGASGENVSENYQNPEWNLNIYQYSDIVIYLSRISDFNDTNNIKRLYIDNINLGSTNLGVPVLYYLNPYDYGTDKINGNNEITDSLEFNVLNSENIDNDISYSIPILFQDLSNPITLKYVNKEIVKSYKFSNEEKMIFNGTLLKTVRVNPKDIENKISFCINIKTGDNRLLKQKIEISIPLKDNNNLSLYDGNIEYEEMLDISF